MPSSHAVPPSPPAFPPARLAPPLLLTLGLAACAPKHPKPRRPDAPLALTVLLDALSARHLSCYGYERETTPNLDALAASGLRFTQARALTPYTLASIASLHTGRAPDQHSLVDKLGTLPPDELTLAEHLSDYGFRTLGLTSNLNGSEVFGLERGFGRFDNLLLDASGNLPAEEAMVLPKAADCVERCLSWLDEELHVDAPTYMHVHILEPHTPYTPPEPFFSRYLDPSYRGPLQKGETTALLAARNQPGGVQESDKQAARALYDANLAYADSQCGRLFKELERRGLWGKALVQVLSDHGEAFWQHGEWGHNSQLYDDMLHVPWIVHFPGGRHAGLTIDQPVSLVDVFPNVCHWLGIPLPAVELDGLLVDLPGFPGRNAAEFEARELFLRTNDRMPDVGRLAGFVKTIASRSERWKPLERLERYDLRQDGLEQQDVAADWSSAERQATLTELQAELNQSLLNQSKRGQPLNRHQEALLRALGYVDEE